MQCHGRQGQEPSLVQGSPEKPSRSGAVAGMAGKASWGGKGLGFNSGGKQKFNPVQSAAGVNSSCQLKLSPGCLAFLFFQLKLSTDFFFFFL